MLIRCRGNPASHIPLFNVAAVVENGRIDYGGLKGRRTQASWHRGRLCPIALPHAAPCGLQSEDGRVALAPDTGVLKVGRFKLPTGGRRKRLMACATSGVASAGHFGVPSGFRAFVSYKAVWRIGRRSSISWTRVTRFLGRLPKVVGRLAGTSSGPRPPGRTGGNARRRLRRQRTLARRRFRSASGSSGL